MRPVCVYTDFFVLATGRNERQTKAIYDEVHAQLKQESRLLPRAVDGANEAEWIIADYLDVVLHVFTPETRQFYRLEDLWGDVPAVELEAAASYPWPATPPDLRSGFPAPPRAPAAARQDYEEAPRKPATIGETQGP